MGKYAKYKKTFKREWLNIPIFKDWLKPGQFDNAYCKVCKIELRAQKADLRRHSKSSSHQKKAGEIPKSQNKLTNIGISHEKSATEQQKAQDLKLAMFITMHTSMKTIDHLCDLLTGLGKGSTLEELRMHRTKCTQVIKKVLAPSIKQEIISDVNNSNSFYSLIVDESTDVSVSKYLCICIRYFSDSQKKMVTEYLGLIPVVRTTANDLYEAVKTFLKENSLKLTKLIGIGTDGANNLCGRHHSLFTLLRTDCPKLQLVKCVCHSVHLCSEKATVELPASLEFLIRETYNWFSISPCRQHDYKQVYDLININENTKQHKIARLAATRWLSRYKAIEIILEQWLELKTHFTQINNKEKCYTSRQLELMYKDPTIHLYLIFLKPILKDLNNTNLLFQSTNADFFKVYECLFSLILNILKRILKPVFLNDSETNINKRIENFKSALYNDLSFLKLDDVDFGYTFSNELSNHNEIDADQENELKYKYFAFLKTLAQQLISRLPENFKILQMLKNLSPTYFLSISKPNLNETFPLEFCDTNVEEIDNEYRNLKTVDWASYFPESNVPQDPIEFWSFTYQFKNAAGEFMFKNISKLALKLLSLPLSNAVVERVFSIMNLVKTKTRNRIILETLDSILLIRVHCKNNNWCCKNFELSKTMFELFNYTIYNYKKSENDEDDFDLIADLDLD